MVEVPVSYKLSPTHQGYWKKNSPTLCSHWHNLVLFIISQHLNSAEQMTAQTHQDNWQVLRSLNWNQHPFWSINSCNNYYRMQMLNFCCNKKKITAPNIWVKLTIIIIQSIVRRFVVHLSYKLKYVCTKRDARCKQQQHNLPVLDELCLHIGPFSLLSSSPHDSTTQQTPRNCNETWSNHQ